MARIRSIKPQFWLDEDLATLEPFARLLYIGLWNYADDRGVFQYRPRRLKAQVFPYDDFEEADMIRLLDGLSALGKFVVFEVDGEQFGHLVNFPKHQKINRPSKYGFVEPDRIPPVQNTNHHGVLTDTSLTDHTPLSLGSREGRGVGSRFKGVGSGVGSREEDALPPPQKNIFTLYEQMIAGPLPGNMVEMLKEAERFYTLEDIEAAFLEAAKYNKRNWAYAKTILERWAREGKDDGRGTTNRQRPAGNRGNTGPDQSRHTGPPRDPLATIVDL